MMNSYDIYLDGVSLSQYATPAGYSVDYEFADGGQGGLMLDGTTRVDELTQVPVITFPCMPLTDTQLRTLYNTVVPFPTHTLSYYDPSSGQKSIRVKRSVERAKYRGIGADGKLYWTGVVLTFKGID